MRRLLVASALILAIAGCGDRPDAPRPAPSADAPTPAATATSPEPAAPADAPSEPEGLAPAPEWAEPAPSASGRPSLLLLGIDGARWDLLEALFEGGYLPNLARLARQGARAELDCTPAMPETACFSPPTWLSIVTGVPQARHGIATLHHEVAERHAATLWDVLHAAGGTTTLVSFRNTWPPEESARYVLTEYGLDWASEQIYERIPPEQPLLREMLAHQRFKPEDLLEQLGMMPHEGARPSAWKVIARDRVAMEALRRLARRERTDLTVALIHGADKAAHLGWRSVQPTPGAPLDREALRAQARAWRGPVEAAPRKPGTSAVSQFLETDAWLGRLLSTVGYDYVVVASANGMGRNPGEGLPGDHGPAVPEGHRGVLLLWGPGVAAGAVIEDVDVFDVAPTLAHLLGLPVAEDLPGRVLLSALTSEWRDAHAVRRVESWDQPKIAGSTSTPTGQ